MDSSTTARMARTRAEKFAHQAVRELGDDPEGLEILSVMVTALAKRSRPRRT